MSQVFLRRVSAAEPPEIWAEAVGSVLRAADPSSFIGNSDLVAVKLHVGEPGVKTHLPPEVAAEVVRYVRQRGARPFLTDTAVLYTGPRSTGVGHAEVAVKHGFTCDRTGAVFLPADGLVGNVEVAVPIQGQHFRSVRIARAIADAHAMVVLSHATGHLASGFGATLKNLGMGCASRKGKLAQHSDTKPFVKKARCQACGACIASCPEHALTAGEGGEAVLDEARCIGCGECIAQCRYGAIGFRWDSASAKLQEKMAEHALGAVRVVEGRVVYLLGIVSLTKDCDCLAPGSPIVARDVGFAASLDPVALDQAAMDLVAENEGKRLDELAYPGSDGTVQLAHAERLGLGTRRYTLAEL
ncbi:MAG: DUF362 domain-containing protein [Polyangiaceae bacterium]|nr:DUF362 domain-containing protein [Polyangiaceae bacterium]